MRHIFRISLDGAEVVYLKADQAFPASEKEAYICDLLHSHSLPAPRVLAVDATGTLLPAPFVIQEHIGGDRLSDLLDRVSRPDQSSIYRALGRFYRQLHRLHHDHSGWIQADGAVGSFSPTAYMYNQVIIKSGQEGVTRGLLAAETYICLKALWSEQLAWLEDHQPSLVTGGALPWTVYLRSDPGWHVTKITDLPDLLYWDPAWDLASLKYPAFRAPLTPELWNAFTAEYGPVPGDKRLQLYRLMQHLDAALGHYAEPPAPRYEHWKAKVWQTFEHLLDDAVNDNCPTGNPQPERRTS